MKSGFGVASLGIGATGVLATLAEAATSGDVGVADLLEFMAIFAIACYAGVFPAAFLGLGVLAAVDFAERHSSGRPGLERLVSGWRRLDDINNPKGQLLFTALTVGVVLIFGLLIYGFGFDAKASDFEDASPAGRLVVRAFGLAVIGLAVWGARNTLQQYERASGAATDGRPADSGT